MILKSKRANIGIYIVIGLLLAIGTGIGTMFLANIGLGSLVGYDSVYKQNWGHIECVQNFDYDVVYTRYADDVSLYKCDDYTNECLIEIRLDRDPGILGIRVYYSVCDLNGNSCSSETSYAWMGAFIGSSTNFKSFTIPVGKSVKIHQYSLSSLRYVTITKKAKSFYIRGVENGKIFVQESCVLSRELQGKVLSSGLNELSKTGTNSRQNYMIDFISVASRTYTYNSGEVICQAREIFKVDSNSFKDGSIKKIQGEKIKGVECCPEEANCDENTFTFKQNIVKECDYSSQCANGGNPIAQTGTTYYTFSCVSGACIQSATKTADCTNTAECIRKYGQGSVCDISTINYGKCIHSTKPNYCGNGKCESLDGENGATCPEDCSNCPTGLVWDITRKVCRPVGGSWWSKIPIWLWIVITFIMLLILMKFVPKFRGLMHRIPVIKYILP